MNYRLAFSCALLAATVAGCSTLHSKEPVKPVSPANTAPATNGESASTSAGGNSSGLSASELAAQDRAAAEKALLSQLTVHFDYDQSTIRPEDQALLKAHAKYLSQHPKARVRLAGHTDERGTTEYNMALGERRAKSVRSYLGSLGVKSVQLDVVSFGKEKPLDAAQNEEAWAKNRRVELNYQNEAP